MKLVIISHTEHYMKEGIPYGWGATVREIYQLAKLFEQIVHIAPLYNGEPPTSFYSYDTTNVKHVSVLPAGGDGIFNKLRILLRIPEYIQVILKEIKNADVVHVRAPANISLFAMVLLTFIKHPKKRWIKYAGNWQNYAREAHSYRFQKWWLKRNFARAKVTVNGEWPNQPQHIHSFYNPCISDDERLAAAELTKGKILTSPVQLIFVGRLEDEKGVGRILKIASELDQQSIEYEIDFVGDGPNRKSYEQEAQNLKGKIIFHGWLSRNQLNRLYQKAHFILLPSEGEGWPKVLSEAMAFGVIPIASKVGSIGEYLTKFTVGLAVTDPSEYGVSLREYLLHDKVWLRESELAREVSAKFVYEEYLIKVKGLLSL